jgi:GT2 family glycosyltransferase
MESPASLPFDLSVVIVSFNTRDMLRECLRSVYRAAGSLRVQVIVVDNASIDGSPAMVADQQPGISVSSGALCGVAQLRCLPHAGIS